RRPGLAVGAEGGGDGGALDQGAHLRQDAAAAPARPLAGGLAPGAVAARRIQDGQDALAALGGGAQDRWRPRLAAPRRRGRVRQEKARLDLGGHLVGAGEVALVDDEEV